MFFLFKKYFFKKSKNDIIIYRKIDTDNNEGGETNVYVWLKFIVILFELFKLLLL